MKLPSLTLERITINFLVTHLHKLPILKTPRCCSIGDAWVGLFPKRSCGDDVTIPQIVLNSFLEERMYCIGPTNESQIPIPGILNKYGLPIEIKSTTLSNCEPCASAIFNTSFSFGNPFSYLPDINRVVVLSVHSNDNAVGALWLTTSNDLLHFAQVRKLSQSTVVTSREFYTYFANCIYYHKEDNLSERLTNRLRSLLYRVKTHSYRDLFDHVRGPTAQNDTRKTLALANCFPYLILGQFDNGSVYYKLFGSNSPLVRVYFQVGNKTVHVPNCESATDTLIFQGTDNDLVNSTCYYFYKNEVESTNTLSLDLGGVACVRGEQIKRYIKMENI